MNKSWWHGCCEYAAVTRKNECRNESIAVSPSASTPPSLLGGRARARRKSTSCGSFFAACLVAKPAPGPVISTPTQGGFANGRRNDRIRAPGGPAVSAVPGIRQAGQRIRCGGLPGAVRRGQPGLRRILGQAWEGTRALAQALYQGSRRIERAVLQ